MQYGDNKPKYIRWAVYAALLAASVLMQNSVGGLKNIFSISIFLAIPVLVSISMFERELPAAALGAFAGILWDISSGFDGFNALVLALIGALCSLLISHFMRNNLVTALVLCAGGTVAYSLVYGIVNLINGGFSFRNIFVFYLPAIVLTVAVMPMGYGLVKIIFNSFKTTE